MQIVDGANGVRFWRAPIKLCLLLLPSLASLVYFGLVASDRFVSEAQIVVRTASRPAGALGFGALLQASGLARTQDDVFSVQAFISSRSAVEELRKRLPLLDMFGYPGADPLARYPSLFYGDTLEELHAYLQWMVTTSHNTTTGITTLRVQAFQPEDAKSIALALLDLGELTVNRLNARIRDDAVRLSQGDVARGEERLVAAQLAITAFRNAETMIDPAGSSIILTELIGRLGAELTQTEAQIREISSAAAVNPQLPSLNRRAQALQDQIRRERERIAADSEGLADKLATYERLVLEREFAKQSLAAAVGSLEAALKDARRQQLYLERVVEPIAPDRAMAPQRARHIASAIGLNVLGILVLWLVVAGFREHRGEAEL